MQRPVGASARVAASLLAARLLAMRRCPICKNQIAREKSDFTPFCSRRCKLIDLGNWLGENYRIPEDAEAEPREERNVERERPNRR